MHDMDQDTNAVTQVRSREHWQQARRKAFLQKLYNAIGLTREPIDLLSFEEVQEKLRLRLNCTKWAMPILSRTAITACLWHGSLA